MEALLTPVAALVVLENALCGICRRVLVTPSRMAPVGVLVRGSSYGMMRPRTRFVSSLGGFVVLMVSESGDLSSGGLSLPWRVGTRFSKSRWILS